MSELLSVRRGDDVLAAIPNVEFIKIDVEGFEAKALAGLSHIISRDRPLVVFEFDGLRNALASFEAIAACLPDYRFSEFGGLQGKGWRRILTAISQGDRSVLLPLERPQPKFYEAIFAFPSRQAADAIIAAAG